MGPIERTRWQLDTPLTADGVLDALVDFSRRREVLFGARTLRYQFRVALERVARGA